MLWVLGGLLCVAAAMETLRFATRDGHGWIAARFGHLFRAEESFSLSGATYVLLGNLVAVLLFEKWVAVTALLFLSISDALASLVGRKWGRTRLLGKSLAGSLAFFGSALLIVAIVQPGPPLAGVLAALAATLAEALSLRFGRFRLDDNFTIPLAAGCALMLASPPPDRPASAALPLALHVNDVGALR